MKKITVFAMLLVLACQAQQEGFVMGPAIGITPNNIGAATTGALAQAVAPLATTGALAQAVAPLATTGALAAVQSAISSATTTNANLPFGAVIVYRADGSVTNTSLAGGTSNQFGQAFLDAVALADGTNTVIRMGPGLYYLPSPNRRTTITATNLCIIGSGQGKYNETTMATSGGTIIDGRVAMQLPYGVAFQDVGFKNSAPAVGYLDVFIFSGTMSSNDVQFTLRNCSFFGGTTNPQHGCQISGGNVFCENIRCYDHGVYDFVLKGASNVVVRNLYIHQWNCAGNATFLIKGGDTNFGPCGNILLDGFVIDGNKTTTNTSGIALLSDNGGGYGVTDVTIQNGVTRYCTGLSLSPNGSPMSNIVFRNITEMFPLNNGFYSDVAASNILLSGVNIIGQSASNFIYSFLTFSTNQVSLFGCSTDSSSNKTSGLFKHIDLRDLQTNTNRTDTILRSVTTERMQTVTPDAAWNSVSYERLFAQTNYIAMGVLSNKIRTAWATNGTLTIAAQSPYTWNTNYLASNDPVWVTSGSMALAAGVWPLVSWGVAEDTNNPIPGIGSNEIYIVLSGPTPTGTVVVAEVRPGKVSATARFMGSNRGARLELNTCCDAKSLDPYFPCVRGLYQVQMNGVTAIPTVTLMSNAEDAGISGYNLDCYPHVWGKTNIVYIGMFGGGNAATGWQGSYFYHNALRLQIFGAEMTVAPTNAVGW